jgi:Carboxypeptidase regulatory-like domain
MPKGFNRLAIAVFLGCVIANAAAQVGVSDLSGRILEATSMRGIENLEVKLMPPRSSPLGVRLTSTGPDGGFHFAGVRPGRYLLEVSQGPNLLYRSEIDAGTQNNIEVALQKRR